MAEIISTGILNKLKADLRIRHSQLDDDIRDTAQACLADLEACGIAEPDANDPLILNVLKLWCRANYTDDTVKAAAYMERYNSFKGSLMMAEGYGGGGESCGC